MAASLEIPIRQPRRLSKFQRRLNLLCGSSLAATPTRAPSEPTKIVSTNFGPGVNSATQRISYVVTRLNREIEELVNYLCDLGS